MTTLRGLLVVLLAAVGLYAQNRSGLVAPRGVTRVPVGVLHPGGTSAMPGVQRTTGSVLFPAGGTPQIGIPGATAARPAGVKNFGRRNQGAIWAYPVYVGS